MKNLKSLALALCTLGIVSFASAQNKPDNKEKKTERPRVEMRENAPDDQKETTQEIKEEKRESLERKKAEKKAREKAAETKKTEAIREE